MKFSANKKEWILCFIIALFPLAVYSLLSIGAYFSHPNIEDFSLALLPRDIGIYTSIKLMMATYDGRYFTNFLHALNPLYFNSILGYKIMPVLGIVFFNGSLFLFLKSLLDTNSWRVFLLSSVITAFHFILTPSLPHQLFWMVSSFVYLYVWSFSFLFFYLFMKYWKASLQDASTSLFFLTALSLVAVIGINEMFLPLITLFLCGVIYFSYGSFRFQAMLPLLLIGFVAIVFFITSPGILGRLSREYKGESIDYKISIFRGVHQYFYFLKTQFSQPLFLSFIFLIYVFKNYFTLSESLQSFFSKSWKKVGLILFVFVLGFLMVQPYYIPIGHLDAFPLRIYNLIQVLFLLGTTFFLFTLPKHQITTTSFYKLKIFLAVLFLFFFYFSDSNWGKMKQEYLDGTWSGFDAEMSERYQLLKAAQNSSNAYKIATIKPLTHKPSTIFFPPDISPHQQKFNWNKALAAYFYLDEVRLEGDSVHINLKK